MKWLRDSLSLPAERSWMTVQATESESLIAPCGMDCGGCIGYLREKNKCPGCRSEEGPASKTCRKCIIRNCDQIVSNASGFCYECPDYPCRRLKNLDKRYRTKYHMSMLKNLESIRKKGLQAFVKQNTEKWTCAECGARLSVHREMCLECGVMIIFA